jgi:hypothetical protein
LGICGETIGEVGGKNPKPVFKVHKYKFESRDLARCIFYQLEVYRSEEIRKVFGMGYTAILEAVKRGRE